MELKQYFYRSICLFIAVSFSSFCYAGDAAELRVIGFSADGGYFSFEQYGVQDGSGFAYSEIFVINTATDKWVTGSPIRVIEEDEDKSLSDIRKLSGQRAAALLDKLDIPQMNLSSEVKILKGSSSRAILTVDIGEDASYSFVLKQWEIDNADCQSYGVTPQLFSLSLQPINGQKENAILLHKDTRLATSRGCPMNYEIYQVNISEPNKADKRTVAVVMSVFTMGFEGQDRRFLAFTSQLDVQKPEGSTVSDEDKCTGNSIVCLLPKTLIMWWLK